MNARDPACEPAATVADVNERIAAVDWPRVGTDLESEPGRDFAGGEFVMTEQRPRMPSRPIVLALRQGDAAVIAVHHRPVQGARGVVRVNLRHSVSRVHSGLRHTAGIIFHDAA